MFTGLSVVIPYYNDTQTLPKSLKALRESFSRLAPDQRNCEFLIIDDCSPVPFNPSSEYSDLPIQVLRQAVNSGVGAARNRGARDGKYSHVVFLDADVVLDPSFLPYLYQYLTARPDTKLVQGPYAEVPANDNPTYFQNYLALSWFHNSISTEIKPGVGSLLVSGCCVFDKAFFKSVGGFLEIYKFSGGEEYEIVSRIPQGSILQDTKLRNYHHFDYLWPRLKKLFRRGRNYYNTVGENSNIPFWFKLISGSKALCALGMSLSAFLLPFMPVLALLTYVSLGIILLTVDGKQTAFIAKNHSLRLALLSVVFRQLEYFCVFLGMLIDFVGVKTHVQRDKIPI